MTGRVSNFSAAASADDPESVSVGRVLRRVGGGGSRYWNGCPKRSNTEITATELRVLLLTYLSSVTWPRQRWWWHDTSAFSARRRCDTLPPFPSWNGWWHTIWMRWYAEKMASIFNQLQVVVFKFEHKFHWIGTGWYAAHSFLWDKVDEIARLGWKKREVWDLVWIYIPGCVIFRHLLLYLEHHFSL